MASGVRPNRGYWRLLLLYPFFLVAYALIAWSDWWLPRYVSNEVFPFFSWDLFSSPRYDGRLYTVHITRIQDESSAAGGLLGRTLVDPRKVRFLREPRFQKTAQSLAKAYWRKDVDHVERLAIQLSNYLRPYGVFEYELVYLSYHPVRYYMGQEEPEEKIVSRFTVAPDR